MLGPGGAVLVLVGAERVSLPEAVKKIVDVGGGVELKGVEDDDEGVEVGGVEVLDGVVDVVDGVVLVLESDVDESVVVVVVVSVLL
jgi:hypothetical protein